MSVLSRLTHPTRVESPELEKPDEIDTFIDSRTLEYPTKIEDDFVRRALALGVEGGMILDVGTRVGLIPLKILWQNENFYAIGMDTSGIMIERARETATAWGLGERAFFQVGDARRMRFKTAYFDLVISDSARAHSVSLGRCVDSDKNNIRRLDRPVHVRGKMQISSPGLLHDIIEAWLVDREYVGVPSRDAGRIHARRNR